MCADVPLNHIKIKSRNSHDLENYNINHDPLTPHQADIIAYGTIIPLPIS